LITYENILKTLEMLKLGLSKEEIDFIIMGIILDSEGLDSL